MARLPPFLLASRILKRPTHRAKAPPSAPPSRLLQSGSSAAIAFASPGGPLEDLQDPFFSTREGSCGVPGRQARDEPPDARRAHGEPNIGTDLRED